MDNLRRVLNHEEGPVNMEEAQLRSNLSESQNTLKIKGFWLALIVGFLFALIGAACVRVDPGGHVIFVVLYLIGNCLAVASTLVLMGPARQLERLCNLSRIISLILVLVFFVVTMLSGLVIKGGNIGLSVIFTILQFAAYTWYAVSFMPYPVSFILDSFNCCA